MNTIIETPKVSYKEIMKSADSYRDYMHKRNYDTVKTNTTHITEEEYLAKNSQ